jgi:hypothetical protein
VRPNAALTRLSKCPHTAALQPQNSSPKLNFFPLLHTVLCCPRHSVMLSATVLCCPRHSVMLPATQCYVASDTVLWPTHPPIQWRFPVTG